VRVCVCVCVCVFSPLCLTSTLGLILEDKELARQRREEY